MSDVPSVVLVISLQPLDAMTTLFFGHLSARSPGRIQIMAPRARGLARALSQAAAVVLVRGLFEFEPVVRCARVLRIPIYYFVDDNFMVLREQGGRGAAFVERYSVDNVRQGLRGFAGVLLASPALIDYFATNSLHARRLLFPPARADARSIVTAPVKRERLHVAFFGGEHLHAFLLDTIVPAVRRLARVRPVTLIVVGVAQPIEASAGLIVQHETYAESYADGVRRLSAAGVDILVHPVAAGLANNAFKNPHALITAAALGAVPVVSDRSPYDNLRTEGVALLCEDSEESWFNALVEASSAESAARVRTRLAAFCLEFFEGRRSLDVIDGILREHRPPAAWSIPARVTVAAVILLIDHARRAVSRAKRLVQPAGAVVA
jgi:hypothetical protein